MMWGVECLWVLIDLCLEQDNARQMLAEIPGHLRWALGSQPGLAEQHRTF